MNKNVNERLLNVGVKALSSRQFELLKSELKKAPYCQVILDSLSTFEYLTIDELDSIFEILCVKFIDLELSLTDFNDVMTNHHMLYMLQRPIIEDNEEYAYLDCYRSISKDGITSLNIIRLLTDAQMKEMSLPNWTHKPFILGDDPSIILVRGDSLSETLSEALSDCKVDLHKLIPVIASVLTEAQCKKIMESSAFKEMTNGR